MSSKFQRYLLIVVGVAINPSIAAYMLTSRQDHVTIQPKILPEIHKITGVIRGLRVGNLLWTTLYVDKFDYK